MSTLSLDVVLYLPFLFVATLLVGLKLDATGPVARAPWMLVMITLVLYIPASVSYYLIERYSLCDRKDRDSRWTHDQYESSDEDDQNDGLYDASGGPEYAGNRRLPPFVYSRDKTKTTLSLILWAYCTVVPWATLPIKGTSSGLNGLYYTLLAILLVTLLVLLLESLFWMFEYAKYGDGFATRGISERFVFAVRTVRDGIIREVSHEDELSSKGSSGGNKGTAGPSDRDFKSKKNKEARANGIQVTVPDSIVPTTTVSIPSALNADFVMGDQEGRDDDGGGRDQDDEDKEPPDMESYEVDTNLVVNQRYVNGVPLTREQRKRSKDGAEKSIGAGSGALGVLRSMDKGKQTRLVAIASLIVAIGFVFGGISSSDPTYYALAFVVSGSIFLSLLLMVLVQRQFRARVWVMGFLLASASYVTLTLKIYNVAHTLTWSIALVPAMVLEVFLFVINLTLLGTK